MANDMEFEKAFGELAYSDIRGNSPGLLDHMEGFQLIEKNDDSTRGIGVASFNLGGQKCYVPMFFDGRLKGGEMLYLKDQDLFIPNQESWVNYILNIKPQDMGAGLDNNSELNEDIMQPDLDPVVNPPSSSKFASADLVYNNMLKSALDKKYAKIRSFTHALARADYPDAKLVFADILKNNIKVASAVNNLFDLKKIASDIQAEIQLSNLDKKVAITNPKQKVKIYDNKELSSQDAKEMSVGDKQKLLKGEIIVRDDRDENEKSFVYSMDVKQSVTNPDTTGFYDVFTNSLTFKKMLVIVNPKDCEDNQRSKMTCLLIHPDKNQVLDTYTSSVFVNKKYDDAELQKYIDSLKTHRTMKIDKIYMLVDKNGKFTMPFNVDMIAADSSNIVSYRITPKRYNYGDAGCVGYYEDSNFSESFSSTELFNTITVIKKDGRHFTQVGKTLFVPQDTKILQLDMAVSKEGPDASMASWESTNMESEDFKGFPRKDMPGSLNAFYAGVIMSGAIKVSMAKDNNEIAMIEETAQSKKYHKFSKSASVKYLTQNLGVDGQAALDITNDIKPLKYHKYLIIKSAITTPPMQDDQAYGYDSNIQAPTTQSLEQYTPVDTGSNPDPQAFSHQNAGVESAAATGQKEVLDTSMLASLVGSVNSADMVDEFLGDIILGMDRIARILFLIYWKPEEMGERYGKEDLVDLEDNLKNVFNNLGDIVLVLKQKSALPEPGWNESSPDLPTVE
jgi:hypothetical protein